MAALCSAPGHGDMLSALFLLATLLTGALAWAAPVDGAVLCPDTGSPLEKRNRTETLLSACVLGCTADTYSRMLLGKDTRTVRFKPSDKGETGEYCWPSHINCNAGESLTQVYVVMPIDTSAVSGDDPLLSIVSATQRDVLKPHREQAVLSDGCGLRYDVMEYFGSGRWEATLCLKMDAAEGILKEDLRCPPFLVSVWQNNNLPPVSHGEG